MMKAKKVAKKGRAKAAPAPAPGKAEEVCPFCGWKGSKAGLAIHRGLRHKIGAIQPGSPLLAQSKDDLRDIALDIGAYTPANLPADLAAGDPAAEEAPAPAPTNEAEGAAAAMRDIAQELMKAAIGRTDRWVPSSRFEVMGKRYIRSEMGRIEFIEGIEKMFTLEAAFIEEAAKDLVDIAMRHAAAFQDEAEAFAKGDRVISNAVLCAHHAIFRRDLRPGAGADDGEGGSAQN